MAKKKKIKYRRIRSMAGLDRYLKAERGGGEIILALVGGLRSTKYVSLYTYQNPVNKKFKTNNYKYWVNNYVDGSWQNLTEKQFLKTNLHREMLKGNIWREVKK